MCYAVLAVVSNCCPPLKGRFLTRYSPVRHCPLLHLDESSFRRFSFDLHVLSTPPAFVLSQDQTLYKSYLNDVSIVQIVTELFVIASNFLSLPLPVIDLTRLRQAFQLRLTACFHKLSSAPVWCFSFRSLFNLQGTRPTRNIHYCSRCQPSCQLLILLIFDNFRCRPAWFCSLPSRTAWLDYHMPQHFATPNFTFCPLTMKRPFS